MQKFQREHRCGNPTHKKKQKTRLSKCPLRSIFSCVDVFSPGLVSVGTSSTHGGFSKFTLVDIRHPLVVSQNYGKSPCLDICLHIFNRYTMHLYESFLFKSYKKVTEFYHVLPCQSRVTSVIYTIYHIPNWKPQNDQVRYICRFCFLCYLDNA